jgi:hypothetical protein
MMVSVQEYSYWLNPINLDTMLKQIENLSALKEPNEGLLKWK